MLYSLSNTTTTSFQYVQPEKQETTRPMPRRNSKARVTPPRQKTALTRIFAVFSVLVVVLSALLFSAAYGLLYATRHYPYDTSPDVCCRAPLSYRNVSFPSPHGNLPNTFVNISGWFFPHAQADHLTIHCDDHAHLCNTFNASNNRATIVVVHGHAMNMAKIYGENKSILHKAVLPFHMAGYNVLAVDLRNHGLSGDALPVSLGKFEALDVLAAVQWVKNLSRSGKHPELDPARIALWGESMGGSTVLFAAGSDKEANVKAIVVDSSFASAKETFRLWANKYSPVRVPYMVLDCVWACICSLFPYSVSDVRPVDMIPSIRCPMFVTHGRTDSVVPFAQSDQIIAAARSRDPAVCSGLGCDVQTMFHEGDHVFTYTTPAVVNKMVNFMQLYV